MGRRQLLKILAAAGGVITVSSILPSKWLKPAVTGGVLPVHAQASAGLCPDSLEYFPADGVDSGDILHTLALNFLTPAELGGKDVHWEYHTLPFFDNGAKYDGDVEMSGDTYVTEDAGEYHFCTINHKVTASPDFVLTATVYLRFEGGPTCHRTYTNVGVDHS